MLYVIGSAIYGMEKNVDSGVYPKLVLHKSEKGTFYLKESRGGVQKLPASRQVCSLQEIIARFGNTAVDDSAKAMEEKSEK